MSQFPHDEFVKEVLPELYQNYGQVIPSADVSSKRREVDGNGIYPVYFMKKVITEKK